MVFKVGLTGGVASGKTTVGKLFMQKGIEVIDADVIARQLLDKGTDCYQQVVALFGKAVLMDKGDINRAWLRELIFTDADAKKQLESIMHPLVRKQMFEAAGHCKQPYCILSVPLLVEAGMEDMVDRVLLVDIEPAIQTSRLISRDKLSRRQASLMLAGQATQERRLAIADDIIDNSGPAEKLEPQVEQLHQRYLELASAKQ